MADIYKEYRIVQTKTAKDTMFTALLWIAGIALMIAEIVFAGPGLGLILALLTGWGAYTLTTFMNKEYEYILTNNELDIDVIYNKSSRKSKFTIDLKKIDIMAKVNDDLYTHELGKPGYTVFNAATNRAEDTTYAIMLENDSMGKKKILISPPEELVMEMYKQSPSKIKK